IVLATCSSYFEDLFAGDAVHTRQNQVVINGLDHDSLEKLILYMYGQSLTVSVQNVQAIMVTAYFLQ
ncbi:hypothetical protein ANCDUO_20812, partial [Ancylostoma duodenale]